MTPRVAPIGERLVAAGIVSADEVDKALALQRRVGGRLGGLLLRLGALSEEQLLKALAEQLAMPLLEPADLPADVQAVRDWLGRLPPDPEWWLDQEALAWPAGETIRCVAKDPLDPALRETLDKWFAPQVVEWCLIRAHDLDKLLEHYETTAHADLWRHTDDPAQLRELAEEAPVIEFVNGLFSQAFDQRASDIHIDPESDQCVIRFRIDGVLYPRFTLARDRSRAIVSRIKLISGIDIAEHRLPQDGRLGIRVSGEELDVRVSTVPAVHGESVVMRLLPKERREYRLDRLGLADDHHRRLAELIREPHGIVLVTGPTGSGKSTTLYAALETINDRKRKIITVEDPVEYQIDGITQIQVHGEIGYTFARALRAILRQDPDVVMIGEIRDRETAEIAIQASLTGHLVFATLHTNDAVSAFTRLIDMGIEPFLVAAPVRAVMAQRLARRLCPHCAAPAEPMASIQEQIQPLLTRLSDLGAPNWKRAVGCPRCQGTGYRGRLGIYEIIETTPALQEQVVHEAPLEGLRKTARAAGFRTLREDGLLKAYQGLTSLDEVLRISSHR